VNDLCTIAEAAPQFKKTPAAMRWWLAQDTCPIKTAKTGGRIFVRQRDIDGAIAAAFDDAPAS
jgi:hypothetical protein